MYKTKLEQYNIRLKEANAELKDITTNQLPMETGISCKVKTYPVAPDADQLAIARMKIEALRTELTMLRDEVKRAKHEEVTKLIDQLAVYIPKTESLKTKTVTAKWVNEIHNASVWKEPFTYFWSESKQAVDAIDRFGRELAEKDQKRKQDDEKTRQLEWCKNYIRKHMNMTEMVLSNISADTIIDVATANLKANHSVAEGLTGEKCYCEDHGENRHYHFADVYWDGVGFISYTNSETY